MLDIEYATKCTDYPSVKELRKWVKTVLKDQTDRNVRYNLAIKIMDEAEITDLNAIHRGKIQATNVLSFACHLPVSLKNNTLGDIALCAPIIQKEAIKQQKALNAHWAHLVIHGTLHLLGYDHEQPADAAIMEAIEIRLVTNLGFPNPYQMEIS